MGLFHVEINEMRKQHRQTIFQKNECGKRNICFTNSSNIKPRYHCNQSGIHVNRSGTNRLIENLLLALSKFECWSKAQVSMMTSVFRKTRNSEEQLSSGKEAKETFKTLRSLRSKHP